MKQLNTTDALYAANIFSDFYNNFDRIDEYLKEMKLESVGQIPTSLPGMGLEDDMFTDFSVHPSEMEFSVSVTDNYTFDTMLDMTATNVIEKSIPGKRLKWLVKETNSNKVVGFIRFGSPVINSKPRNEFLGDVPPLEAFNRHTIMGFNIVPTQPFGFNYLGGKLLAMICVSHLARRTLNDKYDSKICMFETTSLYGSSKSASMYDGMKPYLRFRGLTESNFIPSIHGPKYLKLKEWFVQKNDGEELVPPDASSRKLKTQQVMISTIKKSLNGTDLENFNKSLQHSLDLTEKKRFFNSDYGYENVPGIIMRGETPRRKPNFDNYEFDNVIKWWKKKASKRYENLQNDGRLRTEQEVWHLKDDIDIIR
ncbi:MAG: hypothetical protein CMD98_06930 [Gammaproteobacteria bacterium]|nr:hypothetical protein [Gammaproteobacteria bacterium]